jgi:hypothetical protein
MSEPVVEVEKKKKKEKKSKKEKKVKTQLAPPATSEVAPVAETTPVPVPVAGIRYGK